VLTAAAQRTSTLFACQIKEGLEVTVTAAKNEILGWKKRSGSFSEVSKKYGLRRIKTEYINAV